MRNTKHCPVEGCQEIIFVDRCCCRRHWLMVSAKLRSNQNRAFALYRAAMAGSNADEKLAAIGVLRRATEATLAYIHDVQRGVSAREAGRRVKAASG